MTSIRLRLDFGLILAIWWPAIEIQTEPRMTAQREPQFWIALLSPKTSFARIRRALNLRVDACIQQGDSTEGFNASLPRRTGSCRPASGTICASAARAAARSERPVTTAARASPAGVPGVTSSGRCTITMTGVFWVFGSPFWPRPGGGSSGFILARHRDKNGRSPPCHRACARAPP